MRTPKPEAGSAAGAVLCPYPSRLPVCDMEGSSQANFGHPELVKSDETVSIESFCKQSRNVSLNDSEIQWSNNLVGPLLSSSLYHQPTGDAIGLLSAIPIPLSVMPPGPIPQGNLTVNDIHCEKISSSSQMFVADDNLGSASYPLNKRLKKSSVCSEVRCHIQRDIVSCDDSLVSLSGHRNPCAGEESANFCENEGKIIPPQYPSSVKQRLCEESYNVTQSDAVVTVAFRGSKEAGSSNAIDSRRRRAKITKGIKALEESAPQSGKGTRESVLDDVIDYIKYLKLQITALSQSRLGGEPIYHPFVHLEGFGHYMLQQQTSTEPLEEVIGHLMDSNMLLAVQLLETKGLQLLPSSTADVLLNADIDKFT